MAFALITTGAVPYIQQTGTDTNVSGLNGLDDGYRETDNLGPDGGWLRQAYLNTKLLNIAGTLTINPDLATGDSNQLTFGANAPASILSILNGGELILGGTIDLSNGLTRPAIGEAIRVNARSGDFYHGGINIFNGGTFRQTGTNLVMTTAFRSLSGGSIIVRDGTWTHTKRRTTTNGSVGGRTRIESPNLDIDGLTVYDDVFNLVFIPNTNTILNRLTLVNTDFVFQPGDNTIAALTLEDFGKIDGKVQPWGRSAGMMFINPEQGSGVPANVAAGVHNGGSFVQVDNRLTINIKDNTGNNIDGATIYGRAIDYARGYSRPLPGELNHTDEDGIYFHQTDSDGNSEFLIRNSFNYQNGSTQRVQLDRTSESNNNQKLYFFNYGSLMAETIVNLKGTGNKKVDWNLFPDDNITESASTVVAVYSILEILDKIYNYERYRKPLNVSNVKVPTIDSYLFTGNGTQLLMQTDWSLLVKKDATTVFAVDVATKLITIKATTLSVGSKFKSIRCQGTGTVTADTDEDLTGIGIEDANGNAAVTLLQTITGDVLEVSTDNKASWSVVGTKYRYTAASVETFAYFRLTQTNGNVLIRRYNLTATGVDNELVMSYGAVETINKDVLDETLAETTAFAKKASDNAEQANMKLN